MDAWSDENLTPYMGITAHYIEILEGNGISLHLQSILAGFCRLPDRHSGKHLAQTLLSVIDRLGIASKV